MFCPAQRPTIQDRDFSMILDQRQTFSPPSLGDFYTRLKGKSGKSKNSLSPGRRLQHRSSVCALKTEKQKGISEVQHTEGHLSLQAHVPERLQPPSTATEPQGHSELVTLSSESLETTPGGVFHPEVAAASASLPPSRTPQADSRCPGSGTPCSLKQADTFFLNKTREEKRGVSGASIYTSQKYPASPKRSYIPLRVAVFRARGTGKHPG